ncbi:MAG: YkgJ family cysteine cluster protein [Planctomycetes bacterium]|nr:YkgJ family cysteine cluster protein [Planctomycetota bacterium]
MTTTLGQHDVLPLTCTRAGTCCHGKEVWLNPWELACLARARAMTAQSFRERFTCDGGLRLRFDGAPGWKGLPACSQYDAQRGCVAHALRPLACRLYPLGRQRRGQAVEYIHDGAAFPCLEGCPQVRTLPQLSVGEYLAGQLVAVGESVADAYLEVAQDLAEGAFVIVFDSGYARTAAPGLLDRWQRLAVMDPTTRAAAITGGFLEALQIPELDPGDGDAFVSAHGERLRTLAQGSFAGLTDAADLEDASLIMLAMALQLAHSLGGKAAEFGAVWCQTARANGLA